MANQRHIDFNAYQYKGDSAEITNDIKIDFQLLGTTIPPKEISRIIGITPDSELRKNGVRSYLSNDSRLAISPASSSIPNYSNLSKHFTDVDIQ